MFTVYVDDSGTASSQQVAIATGLIIPAAQIIRLEAEWESLKQKEGFTDFHTSLFAHRNYKSEFGKWDDTKQRRVFERVKQITKKYGIKAASVAVNKEDYVQVLPESFRQLIGEHHFTWAMHHLLSILRTNRPPDCPGFEYVIDWMDEVSLKRQEVEAVMARAEEGAIEDGNPGEFKNYSFCRRKDMPGLQCADFVSWIAYRFSLFAFYHEKIHEFAEDGWKFFGGPLERDGWLGAVAIRREHLQKWYEQLAADPHHLDMYRRVEAKRLARQAGQNSVVNSDNDANSQGKTAQ